ncbi:YceI family protein [Fulvimonas yonginensis]|uniref:YceI family protein n=1 Tax=Fulvimonas yonginensis TaxID=1495200 RepID=A0ABU8JDE9_9GAMM
MSALRAIARLPACAALLLPLASHGTEAHYRYDPVHSQILFSVDHNGFSRAFGRLHIARGWLRFDPDDWNGAATELDIDLAGLDMGDAAWSKAVLGADYLDAAHARYAHFASTSVERTDDHRGVLHGRLTLRGITVPLDIPFTFNRQARTLYGLHTVAGFSATASLDRTAFGITAHPNTIGRHVDVWLQIEAIRDRDRGVPPSSARSTDAPAH